MEKGLTLRDLRAREVIRVCDGKSLGCVWDLYLDACSGRICALELLYDDGKLFTPAGLFCFGKRKLLRVPWDRIQCIGEDAVLVCLEPGEEGTFCTCRKL